MSFVKINLKEVDFLDVTFNLKKSYISTLHKTQLKKTTANYIQVDQTIDRWLSNLVNSEFSATLTCTPDSTKKGQQEMKNYMIQHTVQENEKTNAGKY